LFHGDHIPLWEEQLTAGIRKLVTLARSSTDSDFDELCDQVDKQYIRFKGPDHPKPRWARYDFDFYLAKIRGGGNDS
jgi:hypothetical protein